MTGLAVVAFVVFCVLPVGYLVVMALGSSGGAAALVLDRRQRGLLLNTATLGLGTAMLATALGTPLGVAFARVPFPAKPVLRVLATAPILLPPYVMALAWIFLTSASGLAGEADLMAEWTYSLPAAVVNLSVVFYPLSLLATEVAMRRMDGRLEEAGLIVAPPARVLWRVTVPLVAPSVVAAALIIFVLSVSEFGAPALLRVRVYTTEIFTAFASFYDFSRALVLAVPLLVLSVVVASVAAVLLGDRLVTTRRPLGGAQVVFEGWRRPTTLGVSLVVAASVGLPILLLVGHALQARSPAVAIAGSGRAIANSLLFAALGATASVVLAIWLGYWLARAKRVVRWSAQAGLVALFAMPSTIVGVGLIGLWNRPGLGVIYGSDAMLVMAHLARFVPVAILVLAASAQTVPLSHEEASAVSGAGWLRTMTAIVLPQLKAGIGAAWLITFVLAFGELGVSILVAPPGEATLPIRVYTIIANTPASHVAALALLQSCVIFVAVAALGATISARWAR